MKKIIFVGPPGSGKSTLVSEVFVKLKTSNKNVELVNEYARQYIQEYGPPTSVFEQLLIAKEQEKYESLHTDINYMLIDAGRLSSYFYASLYANYSDKKQRLLIHQLYLNFLDDLYLRRYDYIFFLPITETYKVKSDMLEDGTRFQTPEEIDTLEMHMSLMFGRLHHLDNVYVLDVPLNKRCLEVLKIIA